MGPEWDRQPVFALGCAFGAVAGAVWVLVGEPWELLGDGAQYLQMAGGMAAEPPFAYRVLTPALASALPLPPGQAFAAVTLVALALTAGALATLGHRRGGRSGTLALLGFWAMSFPLAYYATTGIRADGPMLLALATVAALAASGARPVWVGAVLVAGVLAHELALFAAVALGVDRLFGTDLCGGRRFPYGALALMTVAALVALVAVRWLTPTLPPTLGSYVNLSPTALVAHALDYSGGWALHTLRVYAAFGPALVFACAALAARPARDAAAFAALLLTAVALTFLATDTLRVMAVAFVPVLGLATEFLTGLAAREHRGRAALALLLQAAYAGVVFAHLRTFEGSPTLYAAAGALSAAAVAVCLSTPDVLRLVGRLKFAVAGRPRVRRSQAPE